MATTGRSATGGASFLPHALTAKTATTPSDQARVRRTGKDPDPANVNDIKRDRSDDKAKDNGNSNSNVRRQTCRITNDLDAKAWRARKGLAGMAGAQRRHGLSLRIFKM
jgi:hypothetical protein